jgi:TonB family protein
VRGDLPFVSLKEATSLRTHDHFPRLPAALWPDRGPYLVALQVCVSAEGRVSDAALMSHGSARLDPIVVQAVRGWRYRPRLQDGQPGPFCHGILIKYEVAY